MFPLSLSLSQSLKNKLVLTAQLQSHTAVRETKFNFSSLSSGQCREISEAIRRTDSDPFSLIATV